MLDGQGGDARGAGCRAATGLPGKPAEVSGSAPTRRRLFPMHLMPQNFPLELRQLLPLLEALGEANQHLDRAAAVMRQWSDQQLFPVKVQVTQRGRGRAAPQPLLQGSRPCLPWCGRAARAPSGTGAPVQPLPPCPNPPLPSLRSPSCGRPM